MDEVTKLVPVNTGYGIGFGGFGNDASCAIKESEADIRRDVKGSEAGLVRDILNSRSDLKESMGLHRNNSDAQFLSLNNRLCDQDKLIEMVRDEVVKQGYENRLASKDNLLALKDVTINFNEKLQHQTERLSDKAENYQAITTATLARIKCCVCPPCPCPNGND